MRGAFHCSRCGICCRKLPDMAPFRELHDGDGRCRHLAGNLCTIYENRPPLCRVDESYRLFEHLLSYEEYLRVNYESCKTLRDIE